MTRRRITTRVIHTPFPRKDAHDSLNFPVYDSVAFEADSAEELELAFRGEKFRHLYSRITNPTVEYFEAKVKNLTGASAVTALSSGMAAITNLLMAIGKAGDNIISSRHLFGNTLSLFEKTLKPYQLSVKYADLTDTHQVKSVVDKNTIAIFFETMTNPQLEVADIRALATIAKEHRLILIADTTMTPPSVFDASALGVNFEVLSSTKYLSGGATSVGGLVIDYGNYDWADFVKIHDLYELHGPQAFNMMFRKQIYRNMGACLSAHNAYLQILGLDTLDLRTERSAGNAMVVAQWLDKQSGVQQVHYPGLESSPYHSIAVAQFGDKPCSLLTFDLESKEQCFRLMNRLKVIRRSTNLQDNKTLIIHPSSTIFAEYPEDRQAKMGLRNSMIRLSVGIEDVEDLIDDLGQALSSVN